MAVSKKIVLLSIMFVMGTVNYIYALDYKRLHQEADDRNLAEAELAVERMPQSLEDLYILGLVYLNKHKDEEAKEVFEEIEKLNPEITQVKWAIAEVLRRQHKLKKSEKILRETLKSLPDFAPVYISYAYIKYNQFNYLQALNFANVVIKKGLGTADLTSYVRAHLIVGGAKGMLAHYGGPLAKIRHGLGAFSYLEKAERLKPDFAEVNFGIGAFYLLAPAVIGGDLDKSLEYLEKAVNRDPLLADAYVRLAQVHKRKGNNEAYQRYLNKALAIDPANELAVDIKSRKCNFICFN
ncbi:MAG: hypothetical protein JSV34_06680 [Candidatus Omnitrophota bacterium]|nr:MAG: hypothetical protein JSV34_06680 [Candidatus Omnitrophota bacterium]